MCVCVCVCVRVPLMIRQEFRITEHLKVCKLLISDAQYYCFYTNGGSSILYTCLWFCSRGGGLCPGDDLCPGGSLFRWRGLCSGEGSLCPEGVSGQVSVRGGFCQGDPPHGNGRAARILLECIFVFFSCKLISSKKVKIYSPALSLNFVAH